MENKELLPCPFCGGKAKHVYFRFTETYSVCCRNCGAESNEFDTEEEAIEAWNTRSLTFPDEVQEAQHHLCELERITGEAWRPERTCKYIWDANRHVWFCSECGGLEPCSDSVNYCCDCGAKVIGNVE